jgi:hypothetical protein
MRKISVRHPGRAPLSGRTDLAHMRATSPTLGVWLNPGSQPLFGVGAARSHHRHPAIERRADGHRPPSQRYPGRNVERRNGARCDLTDGFRASGDADQHVVP